MIYRDVILLLIFLWITVQDLTSILFSYLCIHDIRFPELIGRRYNLRAVLILQLWSILFCSFCWVLKNSGTSLPAIPRLLLSGSSPHPLYSVFLICSLWILFLAVPPQLRFLKSNLFYVFGGAGPSLPCRFSLVAESGGSFLVAVLWLLIAVASFVAEHGFNIINSQVLLPILWVFFTSWWCSLKYRSF